MDCEEFEQYVTDHLAGTLPAGQSQTFDEHLRTCGACAKQIAELTDTWDTLGDIAVECPDATTRRRFAATLQGYKLGLAAGKQATNVSWIRTFGLRHAAVAATLAIAILLGRWTAPSPSDSQLAALRSHRRASGSKG